LRFLATRCSGDRSSGYFVVACGAGVWERDFAVCMTCYVFGKRKPLADVDLIHAMRSSSSGNKRVNDSLSAPLVLARYCPKGERSAHHKFTTHVCAACEPRGWQNKSVLIAYVTYTTHTQYSTIRCACGGRLQVLNFKPAFARESAVDEIGLDWITNTN
jgi:hypothetical protein